MPTRQKRSLSFFVYLALSLFIGFAAHAVPKVYFITGWPVDKSDPKYVKEAMDQISEHLGEPLVRLHNTDWKKACYLIKEDRKLHPSNGLILIGHSYGAWGVVQIAHCLKETRTIIDLMVTVDAVDRSGAQNAENPESTRSRVLLSQPAHIIPENVIKNVNFYQSQDLFIRGYQKNQRADGSEERIQNFKIKLNKEIIDFHNRIFRPLVEDRVFPQLIDQSSPKDSVKLTLSNRLSPLSSPSK